MAATAILLGCFLTAGLPGPQADSKDCHNISKVVLEGHEAIVPLNTLETIYVDKWNSTNSHWECTLLSMNGKSHPLESKFENQLTVSQENFIVKNASREAQGVYRVRLPLSEKCVALIKLTVQAPMPLPSVIPGNQAPAAHPAWWALVLIPIAVAIVIYSAVKGCSKRDGSKAILSCPQSSGEEEEIKIMYESGK